MSNKVRLSGNIPELKSAITSIMALHQMLEKAGEPIIIDADKSRPFRLSEKPKITLYFLEKAQDADAEYKQVEGQISFRLMKENRDLTLDRGKYFAQQVQSKFATPIFCWRKGKDLAAYTDREKGYSLQLLVRSKEEGKALVEQVLDIQSHSPDWSFFNYKVNENIPSKYPTIPEKRLVLEKQFREPRSRPIAEVWFKYAFLTIPGLSQVFTLFDTTGLLKDPILQSGAK